eukprot:4189685-Prymnesium_polylepis.1
MTIGASPPLPIEQRRLEIFPCRLKPPTAHPNLRQCQGWGRCARWTRGRVRTRTDPGLIPATPDAGLIGCGPEVACRSFPTPSDRATPSLK